jgi:hypothetical protein
MDKGLTAPRKSVASSSPSATEIVSPRPSACGPDRFLRRDRKIERYERKSRHKTKADKYDLKPTSRSRAKEDADTRKTRSTKRPRRKSGLTLNNEFKASNATEGRLTLKGNGGPGMFQNGKASSSLQKRGLPDLSFSEMKFLSKRQDHQTDSKEGKPISKSKKKEKGLVERISGYFEHLAEPKPDVQATMDATLSEPGPANVSAEYPTPFISNNQPVTDLQRVVPNHGLRRSATRNDREMHVSKKRWISETQQPEVQQCKPSSTPASNHQKVDSTASAYSWSITPSRKGRSPREALTASIDSTTRHAHAPVKSFKDQRGHADSRNPHLASHDQLPSEATNESSLSQLSLDQYTQSMLLSSGHDLWTHFPAQSRNSELYTLSDLKHLARLEQLETLQRAGSPSKDAIGHTMDSLRRNSAPGLGEIDGHERCTLSAQGIACKAPRDTGSDDRLSSMPQETLPVTNRQSSTHRDQEVRKPRRSRASSGLRHVTFGPAKDTDDLALTDPETLVTPARRPTCPSYELNAISGGGLGLKLEQPTLQRHPANGLSDPRIYNRSTIDTAQRIIHDIEQEELLAGWDGKISDEAVDRMPNIAVADLDEQTKFAQDIGAPNQASDCNVILPLGREATLQQHANQVQDEEIPREAAGADHYQYNFSTDYDHLDHKAFHTISKRPTTRLQLGRPRLTPNHAVQVTVQRKLQQDAESSFADFWRPHMLY